MNDHETDERKLLVEIDGSEVTSPFELHCALATALEFPNFYGNNWDALWDAITGLIEMPQRLRLRGWSTLESRLPEDSRLLRNCLEDMNLEFPTCASDVEFA